MKISSCCTLTALLLTAPPLFSSTDRLDEALLLGPLPAAPAPAETSSVGATAELVPEVDPGAWLPWIGAEVSLAPGLSCSWRRAEAGANGFLLEEPGVYWLAARLTSDRFDELTVTATGGSALFVDGERLAATWPAKIGGEVHGTRTLGTGDRFVFVRALIGDEGGAVEVTADGEAKLHWDTVPRLSFSDFDRARSVASLGSLVVSPEGQLIARRLSRRNRSGEGRRSEVSVFDARGTRVATELGGPGATPVSFTPDGKELLLKRRGESGTDLLLWTAPNGPARTVVRDEPGLGLVKFSPSGEHLLVATTRGREAEERDGKARRWRTLRGRVTDWDPLPHLHLIDLATGARRRLTAPGDWTLDDAAWAHDGKSILYGRTLPQVERPWFFSQIRQLDLEGGEDRLLAKFTGGWEVRPQGFAPHPAGGTLAFLASPHQVGDEYPEHSVYNKQVWLLDLASGEHERITEGVRYAFASGDHLPAWDLTRPSLILPANAGSRDVLVRLEERDDAWQATEIATAPETGRGWALSPDAMTVAYVADGPTLAPTLYTQLLIGEPFAVETPDAGLPSKWRISPAQDATFTGPGGERIEAWWYRPSNALAAVFDEATVENTAAVPLIVYYYGGNSPTVRRLNTTHQFWAANGYAVLVINPRGAYGYGEEFADHHAGDGGPKAGADVLAGTLALLTQYPQLDPDRVGCYGGSYGGFLTMHLVAHSEMFAAACSMYGIADQATYWGQGTWGVTYGDMANGGALPWRDPEFFLRASPLYQADGIKTPLLLLHGEADKNVTPGESVEMFNALQVLGREVELVTFPGEGHGIAGSFENYVGHRTMMLEWFDRWLKDRPEAWEHRWK